MSFLETNPALFDESIAYAEAKIQLCYRTMSFEKAERATMIQRAYLAKMRETRDIVYLAKMQGVFRHANPWPTRYERAEPL